MIKLKIDPTVIKKFRQAHPTPVTSAPRLLEKYVNLLEGLIEDAMHLERSAFMRKKGIYSINVSKLHQCSQFGKERTRLHKWLEDNNLALIKIVERGNNIRSLNSWVQLTGLVAIEDEFTQTHPSHPDAGSGDEFFSNTIEAEQKLLTRLYPELDEEFTKEGLLKVFDVVPIDVSSLKNYIDWLETEANMIGETKKQLYLRQAKTILIVSKHLDGKYLQRKKRSEFGRIYYEGMSVQNVNKDLRRAMLGDCWEYDVRSSVIAWKMSLAGEYLGANHIQQDVRTAFSATQWYLEEKTEFMQQVQEHTFAVDSNVQEDLQRRLIKEAMTALCFGARLSMHGWSTAEDGWVNPALANIIKNQEERKRFMSCRHIRDFVHEQNLLDTYIYEEVKKEAPDFLKNPLVRLNKRPSKSKVVAYCYQNAESQAMSHAYNFLRTKKIKILAKIHDAFIVRERLTNKLKQELEEDVQWRSKNEYWRLGEKQLARWGAVLSQEEKQRIAAHKAFIANEVEYMRNKIKNKENS